MKLLVCNSKNWFQLSTKIYDDHEVIEVGRKEELNPELIKRFQPDYIFFAHWNWIVSKEIHENSECVVFHTAPLPYGRGGSPIQNLIIDGFTSSPVCAIKMMNECDAGPIYATQEVSLDGGLYSIFSGINEAINVLIMDIIINKPIPVPQKGKPHVYQRLTESDNEIPKGMSLKQIYDRVRMVDHPDYPNAFIIHGDSKFEFYSASLNGKSLDVKCKIKKLI